MYLEQFHLESLGHASYLVGDQDAGEALLLDPRRDVDVYFDAARRAGLRIEHVLDTHGHNDYLSGISEVVARAPGVRVLAPALGAYGYDHRPLRDGEWVELGDVAFEVRHTPGHTPEHVSLAVVDRAVGDVPAALLSGGALLVGDVARPDLLGGDPGVTDAAAEALAETLRERILSLPDHVEVFPTHVAGSLCGGNIGARLSTTVGYERLTNPVLRKLAEGRPLAEVFSLDTLPSVPPYWRRMRAQNLAGPAPLGVVPEPPALTVESFRKVRDGGAVVFDAREPEAFFGGHVPGALQAGLGSSFSTWAGSILPEDAEVVLVLDRPDDLWEATWQLLRIGYRAPVGWLAEGMTAWRTAAEPLRQVRQVAPERLRELLERGEVALLDVRQPSEWAEGHVEGATFITGAELPERVEETATDERPLAVMCGSGYRSSVAISVLLRAGHAPERLLNAAGGMSAWEAAGLPTVPAP